MEHIGPGRFRGMKSINRITKIKKDFLKKQGGKNGKDTTDNLS